MKLVSIAERKQFRICKMQKRKNAKYCLQCTDNQCDMICAVLRSFVKGAKWGVLRGRFWLFADGWPLIFCNNKSKNTFFCFWGRGRFASPQHPCNFNERVSLIVPLLFSSPAFSFRFFSTEEQKNIFFTLAVGLWLCITSCWTCLTLFNLLTLGIVQASLTLLSLNRKFQHLTASLYLLPLLGEILN